MRRLIILIGLAYCSLSIGQEQVGTMTGNDGKVYQTVKIGSQWWMAENLRETKYRDGSDIIVFNSEDFIAQAAIEMLVKLGSEPPGMLYINERFGGEINASAYGYLYNWYAAADSLIIAPRGWRVPSDEDWKRLEMHLGMSREETNLYGGPWDRSGRVNSVAGKLKATAHWKSPNTGATDECGFGALPAGDCGPAADNFYGFGATATFWSATSYNADAAWVRTLSYQYSQIYRSRASKRNGYSLRLIREN